MGGGGDVNNFIHNRQFENGNENIPFGYSNTDATDDNVLKTTSPYFLKFTSCSSGSPADDSFCVVSVTSLISFFFCVLVIEI